MFKKFLYFLLLYQTLKNNQSKVNHTIKDARNVGYALQWMLAQDYTVQYVFRRQVNLRGSDLYVQTPLLFIAMFIIIVMLPFTSTKSFLLPFEIACQTQTQTCQIAYQMACQIELVDVRLQSKEVSRCGQPENKQVCGTWFY